MPRAVIVPESVFRLKVFGVVKGVGYRWSTVKEARRLGVRGEVRMSVLSTCQEHCKADASRRKYDDEPKQREERWTVAAVPKSRL